MGLLFSAHSKIDGNARFHVGEFAHSVNATVGLLDALTRNGVNPAMNQPLSVTQDDILVRPFFDREGKFVGYGAGFAQDFPYDNWATLPTDAPQTPAEAIAAFGSRHWPEAGALAVGGAWLASRTNFDEERHFDDLKSVVGEKLPGVFGERAEEIATECLRRHRA